MRIWVDMDGVVANFDGHYFAHFDYWPKRFPEEENVKWDAVAAIPNFYRTMPKLAGADRLMTHVVDMSRQLRFKQVSFLTGVPANVDAAANDKVDWAADNFLGIPVVCCRSRDKWRHGEPGDILIDDYTKYRVDWERMGGVFILHTSVDDTINQLAEWERCPSAEESLSA